MEYKLSEIAEIVSGGTPSTKNVTYWNGKISWITPKDLSINKKRYISCGERNITEQGLNNSSAIMLPKNSILFTSRAPIGYIAISENEVCTNQGFKSLICDNSKCYFLYLYYWLLNNIDYIKSQANGSTFQEISGTAMKKIKINLPSINIQKKIAKILDCFDKKIELNNQINDNLFNLGDTLYKKYFKSEESKNYRICKIKDVVNNYDYKRKPMSSREREEHQGKYPYYGATSIIDYVDDYIFDGTYLLMGEDGTVVTDEGKPVLQYIWGKNWVNNHAHVLEGKNISTEHLMFSLRNCYVGDIITGAVQPKINQENMNNIEIILSDEENNEKFENIVNSIMRQYKNNIEQNKRLERLRDTLLPKLLNGEIDLDKVKI